MLYADTGTVMYERVPRRDGSAWLHFDIIPNANLKAALWLPEDFDDVAQSYRIVTKATNITVQLLGPVGEDWTAARCNWADGINLPQIAMAPVLPRALLMMPLCGRLQLYASLGSNQPVRFSILVAPPASASHWTGDCDRDLPVARYPRSGFRVYTFTWLSDANGRWEQSFDAMGSLLVGWPLQVFTIPAGGSLAPTALYDLQLIGPGATAGGVMYDLLGDAALNRSATLAEIARVVLYTPDAAASRMPTAAAQRPEPLRLVVSNAGAGKGGTIRLVTCERDMEPYMIPGG